MGAVERSALAITFSVLLSSLTIRQLTQDGSYLGLSWLLVLLLGGLGVGLRRLRAGSPVVLGVQLATLVGFSILVSLTTAAPAGTSPRAPWFEQYPALWESGIAHMQSQSSPMAPNEGVKLIFVTVIGAIMVMTDLLVLGIGRPAWAIAPPGTLFLVPAVGLGFDTGLANFFCLGLGYLAILVAEGLNRTARWPRGLSRDSAQGFGTATPVVWRAAGYLAGPALVGAALLALLVPTFTLPGLGFGSGPGGNGPLQLTDPTLDLRRNLRQPQNRPVIEYRTNIPGGTYLRMATLPQLSAGGWSSVQIQLQNGRTLPPVPGLDREPEQLQRTSIQILDFGSQYLPLPYAPRQFDAAGEWRFDANSLVVVNADNRTQTLRRLSYTVRSVDVAPDGESLARARAGTPTDSGITATLPRDLPQSLIDLTRTVTRGARTDAAKAAAIQAYLRSSRFTYSVEELPGNGYTALENFLLRDRRGYCEQFAAAMAVMARASGIPSRVSVGFLPGKQTDDGWEVSIRDMHAWPELYFEEFGWVRFEPTPSTVTGAAPPWTVQVPTSGSSEPTLDPTAEPSAADPSSSAEPSAGPTDTPVDAPGAAGSGLGRTIGVGLAAFLALLVLAAPATVRVRRRAQRLDGERSAEEQVEGAWSEIRDSVVDLGGSWPRGTPRTIGHEIASRLEPEDSAAMNRVSTLVERARYARALGEEDLGTLDAATTGIRRGLAATATRRRKLSALLLPRSLFRRRRE